MKRLSPLFLCYNRRMNKIYTYTLAFVLYKSNILMLNRHKSPWLGLWNGLGGKIIQGETPKASIQRELHEEMGVFFDEEKIIDKGYLTWNMFEAQGQGIHLFVVQIDKPLEINFPKQTEEGILDMKSYDWVMDKNNYGVAPNIKFFLEALLKKGRIHAHCVFEEDTLKHVELTSI